ncbi:MAG: DUF2970 domain-containing protein [Litorilituus sp.]|jgi:hypothetical protein|nr:DUF2970 domain-containing protein [Litorilituus sp.]
MINLTLWQVILSVVSAFFGVQNDKTRHRDFSQGNLITFIFVGLLITLTLILIILALVSWVLPD